MPLIDERVVEMSFDGKKFEAGIEDAISALNRLDNSTRKGLNSVASSVSAVEKSMSSFSMQGLSRAITDGIKQIGLFEVTAINAFMRISNTILDTGRAIVNNFIKPMTQGFTEYETQIDAVQTILSNTKSNGTTIDQVNKALDELNEYADRTIYNFTQMTDSIGKFTAAGVDLDTSVAAIKGISNLAAVSGSNAAQAGRAMIQFSQALAMGSLKVQDYNSIITAGLGGKVFQDALIETARVHGVAIDQILEEEGSFRESLSKGWATTDILLETLEKFTGDLQEDQLRAIGYTDEQIAAIQQLGVDANKAATEIKTVSQLKGTLEEMTQSGWTQTWKIIIGDINQATVLLTSISNFFEHFITKFSGARNNFLENVFGTPADRKVTFDEYTKFIHGDFSKTHSSRYMHFEDELVAAAREAGIEIDEILARNSGSVAQSIRKEAWLTADLMDSVMKTRKIGYHEWLQFQRSFFNVDDETKDMSVLIGLQDALVEKARESGIAIDEMLERSGGSFFESLNEGWLTQDLLDSVISGETISGSNLEALQQVVDEVWMGAWGNGEERWAALAEAGWDPELVQSLVDMGYGQVDWDNLTFEQMQAIGLTEEQIAWLQNLETSWDAMDQRMTGRDMIVKTIQTVLDTIVQLSDIASTAWDTIFPPIDAGGIQGVFESIMNFTGKIAEFVDAHSMQIENFLEGVFTVIALIGDIGGAAFSIITGVVKAFVSLFATSDDEAGDRFVTRLSEWADGIKRFRAELIENGTIKKFVDGVLSAVKEVFEVAGGAVGAVISFFKGEEVDLGFLDKAKSIIERIRTSIRKISLKPFSDFLVKIRDFLATKNVKIEWLDKIIDSVSKLSIGDVFDKIKSKIDSIMSSIGIDTQNNPIARIISWFTENESIHSTLDTIKGKFETFKQDVNSFIQWVLHGDENGGDPNPIIRIKQWFEVKILGDGENPFKTLIDKITAFKNTTINKFISWIETHNPIPKIKEWFNETIFGEGENPFKPLIDKITAFKNTTINKFISWIETHNPIPKIKAWFSEIILSEGENPFKLLIDIITEFKNKTINKFIDWIDTHNPIPKIKEWFNETIIGNGENPFKLLIDIINEFKNTTINKFIDWIDTHNPITAIKTWFEDAGFDTMDNPFDPIITWIETAKDKISKFFTWLFGGDAEEESGGNEPSAGGIPYGAMPKTASLLSSLTRGKNKHSSIAGGAAKHAILANISESLPSGDDIDTLISESPLGQLVDKILSLVNGFDPISILTSKFNEIWEWIKGIASEAGVSEALSGIDAFITDADGNPILALKNWLAGFLPEDFDFVSYIRQGIAGLVSFIINIPTRVRGAIETVQKFISEADGNPILALKNWIASLSSDDFDMAGIISTAISNVEQWFAGIGNIDIDHDGVTLAMHIDNFRKQSGLDGFIEWFNGFKDDFLENPFAAIEKAITDFKTWVLTVDIDGDKITLGDHIENIKEKIGGAFDTLWTWLTEELPLPSELKQNPLKFIVERIQSFIADITVLDVNNDGVTLSDHVSNFINGVGKAIQTFVNWIVGILWGNNQATTGSIEDTESRTGPIKQAMQEISQGIHAFDDVDNRLLDTIKEVVKLLELIVVKSAVKNLTDFFGAFSPVQKSPSWGANVAMAGAGIALFAGGVSMLWQVVESIISMTTGEGAVTLDQIFTSIGIVAAIGVLLTALSSVTGAFNKSAKAGAFNPAPTTLGGKVSNAFTALFGSSGVASSTGTLIYAAAIAVATSVVLEVSKYLDEGNTAGDLITATFIVIAIGAMLSLGLSKMANAFTLAASSGAFKFSGLTFLSGLSVLAYAAAIAIAVDIVKSLKDAAYNPFEYLAAIITFGAVATLFSTLCLLGSGGKFEWKGKWALEVGPSWSSGLGELGYAKALEIAVDIMERITTNGLNKTNMQNAIDIMDQLGTLMNKLVFFGGIAIEGGQAAGNATNALIDKLIRKAPSAKGNSTLSFLGAELTNLDTAVDYASIWMFSKALNSITESVIKLASIEPGAIDNGVGELATIIFELTGGVGLISFLTAIAPKISTIAISTGILALGIGLITSSFAELYNTMLELVKMYMGEGHTLEEALDKVPEMASSLATGLKQSLEENELAFSDIGEMLATGLVGGFINSLAGLIVVGLTQIHNLISNTMRDWGLLDPTVAKYENQLAGTIADSVSIGIEYGWDSQEFLDAQARSDALGAALDQLRLLASGQDIWIDPAIIPIEEQLQVRLRAGLSIGTLELQIDKNDDGSISYDLYDGNTLVADNLSPAQLTSLIQSNPNAITIATPEYGEGDGSIPVDIPGVSVTYNGRLVPQVVYALDKDGQVVIQYYDPFSGQLHTGTASDIAGVMALVGNGVEDWSVAPDVALPAYYEVEQEVTTDDGTVITQRRKVPLTLNMLYDMWVSGTTGGITLYDANGDVIYVESPQSSTAYEDPISGRNRWLSDALSSIFLPDTTPGRSSGKNRDGFEFPQQYVYTDKIWQPGSADETIRVDMGTVNVEMVPEATVTIDIVHDGEYFMVDKVTWPDGHVTDGIGDLPQDIQDELMAALGQMNSDENTANEVLSYMGDSAVLQIPFALEYQIVGESGAESAVEGLSDTLESSTDQLSKDGAALGTAIDSGFSNAMEINSPSKVMVRNGQSIIEGLSNGMQSMLAYMHISISKVADFIVSEFDNVIQLMTGVGQNIAQGLANGIGYGNSIVVEAATNIANNSINAAKETLGIQSPSKAFESIGINSGLGYANGLLSMAGYISDVSEGLGTESLRSLESSVSLIKKADFGDGAPLVKPVVDLSEITDFYNSAARIQSDFMSPSLMTQLNIDREGATTIYNNAYDDQGVIAAIYSLNARIDQLDYDISNMSMVMDTGALVGQLAPGIDKKMGASARRKARGV